MLKTPLHLQCQYAYKTCTNPRTQKKDGDIHKLCAVHRDKANSVQKIYAAKRRARAREQRKLLVMQAKAVQPMIPVPTTSDREPPCHQAPPAPYIHAPHVPSLDILDMYMTEPTIEPILSPSDRRSFSIEESEFLRLVLLSTHET
ncbi:hypothetical protein H310_10237 [Aphanomyces invadans]|uniref:Uncharacterized protein n=1 Tax=Aphanomyces invadans TaxID=157072 RepID=A0A024TR77_9STRA|nr:hypothetical protein H310_10237 [Aphanomyces invadans]ETV96518.1 hypothetical protein H310_10237 [Aphanomyces invadans]|eukprot:XP_008874781.1 hypothetical protein H310_10237 [Aphanomyces invadans]